MEERKEGRDKKERKDTMKNIRKEAIKEGRKKGT